MKDLLQDIVRSSSDYVELRYHKRVSNSLKAHKGRIDVANHSVIAGIGVRVLFKGTWGFAATTRLDKASINNTIEQAKKNAALLIGVRKNAEKIELATSQLAVEDFVGEGFSELKQMAIGDKMARVIDAEKQLRESSTSIHSAGARYNEILEEKVIVTSDGAAATLAIALPEFTVSAIAESNGEQVSSGRGAGVSGGWQCLYDHPSLDHAIENTAKLSVDLLKAGHPDGGHHTCILDPAVVGLLCHEAIGHTVEADFVKSGSVAKGMIGKEVASDLVTMVDSGAENIAGYAVGNLPFDDEGVKTEKTTIIEKGKLVGYLHNRESANEFKMKPTGNARAWLYNDEPLIRMRNTYIEPGKSELNDMIASMDDGYLIEGAGSGQADANGEFMFGCSHTWKIKNGKKNKLLREATMSGIAFDVLKTVDAVSKEFRWDLGTGYCGKGQPAKVDAGGPFVKCKIHLGGR